ncbi:helix-turn-helix domain-containing protein [Mesorhizobium sp. LHD-90]|uniref:MarR family winged helix-turn-helix transcriptional regulator n=1 Tax=Mesorhizobium sp. LHD-90 TaxID=3071414 RepID=UPI0027E0E43D|nr:helix-turn-helix domain-containing protein [Mesorhizobium sp. LHD-90]MDQ6436690.1 helix-turn-helix domain-containing protein [Mesorhizobium sp. LHD-90]
MSRRSFTTRKPALLSEVVELAWVRLMRSQRRIFESIERDLQAEGCPPLAWYDVMLELDRAEDGRLRPMEIERRTLFAQPNLSRMIARLEREGLVRREAFSDDGRGHWVVITEQGRRKRAAMWEIYGAAIEKHLGARLTDGEAEHLADLLAKLV